MDEASRLSVNIDELEEKAGQRVAELLGSESAIVTSGCAGALAHATAACVAGAVRDITPRKPVKPGHLSKFSFGSVRLWVQWHHLAPRVT